MITAIDFGCSEVRAAYRSSVPSNALTLVTERAEYAALPDEPFFREELAHRGIGYAVCEDSLIVFGNHARDVLPLARQPLAPLFTDGHVPTADAPARQALDVLIQAMLPTAESGDSVCCMTVPGGLKDEVSREFLGRLIRINRFVPVCCAASEAVMLAEGRPYRFSGLTVCMGAERTEIGLCRNGRLLAVGAVPTGGNQIDIQFARATQMLTWDDRGTAYLDMPAVRKWKESSDISLLNPDDDPKATLAGLYSAAQAKIASEISRLLNSPIARHEFSETDQLPVICTGGGTLVHGFAETLTERLVEHRISRRISTVTVPGDALYATVRGLLIYGRLYGAQAFAADRAA